MGSGRHHGRLGRCRADAHGRSRNRKTAQAHARQNVPQWLMVALLAYCPIRLKNFAALEIGRSFVSVDGTWWIVLTAAETKEKREDERPVPDDLTRSIERYLQIYRPVL